jgi:hypothetical protein
MLLWSGLWSVFTGPLPRRASSRGATGVWDRAQTGSDRHKHRNEQAGPPRERTIAQSDPMMPG